MSEKSKAEIKYRQCSDCQGDGYVGEFISDDEDYREICERCDGSGLEHYIALPQEMGRHLS